MYSQFKGTKYSILMYNRVICQNQFMFSVFEINVQELSLLVLCYSSTVLVTYQKLILTSLVASYTCAYYNITGLLLTKHE